MEILFDRTNRDSRHNIVTQDTCTSYLTGQIEIPASALEHKTHGNPI